MDIKLSIQAALRKLGLLFRPKETESYHAYTRDFDIEIKGSELDRVLHPLSPKDSAALEDAWSSFSGALQGWRTKLHLTALEAATRIRAVCDDHARKATTVSILIDQSGSMRGQSMLLAAATADVASEFLRHLDISVEVLGFTTVGWKGGRSRRRWLTRGFPRKPGRLCDLLHIVYRAADDMNASTGGWHFKPMLRPDLPKENVDGEALEWAAARLRSRPQSKKLLVVISDGAPVDDSTLVANGSTILHDHLNETVTALEQSPDIDVMAVGIGFDVALYYKVATTVKTPEDLGAAVIGLLECGLTAPSPSPKPLLPPAA